ncbi:hypothetical protein BDR03DRAFT_411597 [Suillus americanus]|nr:hypothetical protein BDR03DRAFT_411597 [Suillus americanus]
MEPLHDILILHLWNSIMIIASCAIISVLRLMPFAPLNLRNCVLGGCRRRLRSGNPEVTVNCQGQWHRFNGGSDESMARLR